MIEKENSVQYFLTKLWVFAAVLHVCVLVCPCQCQSAESCCSELLCCLPETILTFLIGLLGSVVVLGAEQEEEHTLLSASQAVYDLRGASPASLTGLARAACILAGWLI